MISIFSISERYFHLRQYYLNGTKLFSQHAWTLLLDFYTQNSVKAWNSKLSLLFYPFEDDPPRWPSLNLRKQMPSPCSPTKLLLLSLEGMFLLVSTVWIADLTLGYNGEPRFHSSSRTCPKILVVRFQTALNNREKLWVDSVFVQLS